ncbi:hypothetical protein BDV25DRAFT_132567 [Aspergillus avenaceus]|uniref:Uncharacterized protein n=1 Tax=Aspergillus avenaceus TaxID=36643 RepID=A0A5N6TKI9_ASPAV|nr:hypothetical protein BDV25DRAFT_132567 [Aspergillus avenaceus]
MDAPGQTWTEIFFDRQPPLNLDDMVHDSVPLRQFPCHDKIWKLGERVSQDMPAGRPILVLWIYFPDYPEHEARAQLRRIPSEIHSIDRVKNELDPFLNETRAYEHIDRCCPVSRRAYFPRFYGVITDINRSRFPERYRLRRRAIVLETIKPNLASRRILAAERFSVVVQEFGRRLRQLSLTSFEIEWYQSLLDNRLRRVNALYDIGITHGDIRDDHFRIPGDFYDTVLYDFSISYTYSPNWPYCVNAGRPRSLSSIQKRERNHIQNQIYRRAEQLDIRNHIAQSCQTSLEIIEHEFCCPLNEKGLDLEMIILKVMNRPDVFAMPSLATVLPFLERACPEHQPTWYISRARSLKQYESAWILHNESEKQPGVTEMSHEIISLCGKILANIDNLEINHQSFFFLVLLPRDWVVEDLTRRLLAVCSSTVSSGREGVTMSKAKLLRD